MSTQPMLQKIKKYLRRIHHLLITDKLSLQLEASSKSDKFTVIPILFNNDVKKSKVIFFASEEHLILKTSKLIK